ISILKSFEVCENFVETPFNVTKTILPNNFPIENFEQIIIKCSIDEAEVSKIISISSTPQAICVESIESFVEKKWPLKKKTLHKTITCNPFESQYLYLIQK